MLKSEDELKETTLIISGDVQAERDHSVMYFMCVMCLGAHVSECLPANNLTGLVISAKRAFHCSHRIVSETGNGTHTPHSEPERNSLWAAPYYTYTHYIRRNLSRPKTNTILESITAKNKTKHQHRNRRKEPAGGSSAIVA